MCKRLLLLTLITLPAMGFGDSTPEKLTIRIVDHASIPRATLRSAALGAEGIFRRSGVETRWLVCPAEECDPSVSYSQLVVGILAPSEEGRQPSRHRLGTAIPTDSRAFVFYSDVKSSGLAREYSISVLLAAVMAHEAAHLLGLEHADSGIMRGGFSAREIKPAAVGLLKFSGTQATQLRSAIQARLGQGQTVASAAPTR